MRQTVDLNRKWAFSKESESIPSQMPKKWIYVNLPHTWNGIDGQDGGGDYYRGTCFYAKELRKADLPKAEKYFLEFQGANSSADVYVDGQKLFHHDGGYSTFRVDVTDALQDVSLLTVAVDNSPTDSVYPQQADFTFYGGLYRNVRLICVPRSHFELEHFGTPGIKITPHMESDTAADASIEMEVWAKDAAGSQTIEYEIKDMEGRTVAETACPASQTRVTLEIPNAHRWNGLNDAYLYTAEARLLEGNDVLDSVSARFGCRTFSIDAQSGFYLNGKSYPLHGVSRHQDRPEIGNALKYEHHKEDIDLITEMGATTIRLAHYQHAQEFYDLCDEKGLIVWAEIPYISSHLPGGRDNTISQMKELITQNYNHPCIVVWGLSNEITISGSSEDLLENHRILNDLAHSMDPTRKTCVAVVSACDIHDPYLRIPDVISYNHYYGWYGGDTSMNGPALDEFHREFPDTPIGMSEYGCEALNWHSSDPKQGDYTEEYQAHYHEELIKQLFTRPYIWATHVWNMFDFAADSRSEGGEDGMNHKGLVTFDRKYRKDSFYAYKAWLSKEPFVHICGKRYTDRVEETTKVTVYSNLPTVQLYANGKLLETKTCQDHFFYFDVPNAGITNLVATAGDCSDHSLLRKADTFNEAYRLHDKGAIINWYEMMLGSKLIPIFFDLG